jgi:hypothetical protein
MLLSVSFVPVKQITSNVPRSNFSDDELNRIADLILKIEGVINPLILRSTSLESYEVIEGHLEYYAATRAREIDLRKGEMIGAFIIESNNQEAFEGQIKLLRAPKAPTNNHLSTNSNTNEPSIKNMESRQTNLEFRQNNFESRIENRLDELKNEWTTTIKHIHQRLNELENRIPKPIEPLDALNNWDMTKLTAKLSRVIQKKIIENIVVEREKNGKFTSFSDIVNRTKSLGDKTMLKIIDSFADNCM